MENGRYFVLDGLGYEIPSGEHNWITIAMMIMCTKLPVFLRYRYPDRAEAGLYEIARRRSWTRLNFDQYIHIQLIDRRVYLFPKQALKDHSPTDLMNYFRQHTHIIRSNLPNFPMQLPKNESEVLLMTYNEDILENPETWHESFEEFTPLVLGNVYPSDQFYTGHIVHGSNPTDTLTSSHEWLDNALNQFTYEEDEEHHDED